MSEQDLVALVQSGIAKRAGQRTAAENSACDQFAQMCYPVIQAKMQRLHDPHNEIDDHVQNLWLVLCRKLPKLVFDPVRAPIIAWVSAIAERQARKLARRWRMKRLTPVHDAELGWLIDPEPGPDVEVEWMQEHELFRALVSEFAASLPERDGSILLRRFVKFQTVSEIARELEVSVRCVGSVQFRLLPRLRSFLRRAGSEPL